MNTTTSRAALCLVLSAAMTLQGCWGTFHLPEKMEFPAVRSPQPITGIVVGDFLQGFHSVEYETWTSGNTTYQRTTERFQKKPIELEIAEALVANGIPARAMFGKDLRALKPGEVLLRGAIQSNPGRFYGASEVIQTVLWGVTCLIYGGVIPFFYPYKIGTRLHFRIDMTDPQGNIVMAHNGEHFSYYKNLYIWPGYGGATKQQGLSLAGFKPFFARQLADAIRPHLAPPAARKVPDARGTRRDGRRKRW